MRKRNQLLLIAVISTCNFFGVIGSEKHHPAIQVTKKTSSNIAIQWMQFITEQAKKEGVLPPPSLRLYAYTGLALYESVAPGTKDYQSLYTILTGHKIGFNPKAHYHLPTCANTSLAAVLRKLNILKSIQAIDSMELVCQSRFQGLTASQLKASVSFGNQVADSVYEWSKTDGTFDTLKTYNPPKGPGYWVLPSGTLPVHSGIRIGYLRTFIPGIVSLADPGAPPAYSTESSSMFYQYAADVYRQRLSITERDSLYIVSWQNKPKLNYNTMTHLQMLLTRFMERENFTLENSAMLYAKNGIAMFDAITASLFAKHKYNLVNPDYYINNIMHHESWKPVYPYNSYPSYPSNVAACVSSSAFLMAKAFGKDYTFIDSINNPISAPTYTSFTEFVNKVAYHQVRSGLEYIFSTDAGISQGYMVGTKVNNLPLTKGK
jgi:hypothetical protein